jgi:hypothetical protein
VLLVQIWNWLGYLAKIPIKDADGNDSTMNLYRKALDTLIEKSVGPNGEKPVWLEIVEQIFHWGVKHAKLID